ncbi:hypothetical protein [Roseinatronobacter sp. S2]|uniref:hypothetical protein n=1 Tax=Roseinatronobacter sp. S2 TaxID=3035471 RepID=UPI0027955BF1|nr:hypothetical protein [Roseinatronobacter sp. S2]
MRVLLALVLLLGIGLAGVAAKTIHDRIISIRRDWPNSSSKSCRPRKYLWSRAS